MQFSLIIPWFPENIYFKQLFIGVRTMSEQLDIIYTKVDEAPQLASGSFLPIIQSFTNVAGVRVGTKDISLAGRIVAQFPERLKPEQQQPDDLALLGEIVLKPEANVIKLPNISASIPQIKAAVEELQSRGVDVNDGLETRLGYLDALGVPSSATTVLQRIAESTHEEAEAVAVWAKHRDVAKIMIVTTGFHTARARLAFSKSFRGQSTALLFRASRTSAFDPGTWWHDRHGVRTVLVELQKQFYYRFMYWLGRSP